MSALFENLHFDASAPNGTVKWQSPSNIAIVKYWGKYGNQLPSNANLSFTLSTAVSETQVEYALSPEGGLMVDFRLDGQKEDVFETRIKKYLSGISDYFPFITNLKLTIHSKNSFPHSSGIASSASGMSALALCLCSIAEELHGEPWEKDLFLRRASFLARIGSGSASRSLFPKAALWGNLAGENYTDEYAVPVTDIHPNFIGYRDSILLIHEGQKEVSSSVGHSLMNTSAYKNIRFSQANTNVRDLMSILKTGDLDGFIRLCEEEAMTLHGLMMLSRPPYILMKPATIQAIQIVQSYRQRTKIPVCFSLDAGPNLHILYPDKYHEEIKSLIETELQAFCQDGKWLDDQMGEGPVRIL